MSELAERLEQAVLLLNAGHIKRQSGNILFCVVTIQEEDLDAYFEALRRVWNVALASPYRIGRWGYREQHFAVCS